MYADRPAGGVLAEEDTLRPTVNLDLLDVEGIDQLGGAGADHHIVDQQADDRILALFDIRVAETANENGRGAGAGGVQADEDVGRLSGEIQQGSWFQGFDLGARHGGNSDRHLLKIFG